MRYAREISWINQAFNGLLGPLMSTLLVFWLNLRGTACIKMVAALVVPKWLSWIEDIQHPWTKACGSSRTFWGSIWGLIYRVFSGPSQEVFGSIEPKIPAATPLSAATDWRIPVSKLSHGDKYQRTGRSYHDKAVVKTDIGVNDHQLYIYIYTNNISIA